jgi:hypothetical protein
VRAHRPALDERKPTGHSALQNWEASRAPQASGAWSVVHGEGRLAAKARPRPLWPAAPLAIALPLVVSTAEPPPACRSEQEQRLVWNEQTIRERRRRDESGRGQQLPAFLACPSLAFPTLDRPFSRARAGNLRRRRRLRANDAAKATCPSSFPARLRLHRPHMHTVGTGGGAGGKRKRKRSDVFLFRLQTTTTTEQLSFSHGLLTPPALSIMLATLAAPLLIASTALAHVRINYPLVRRSSAERFVSWSSLLNVTRLPSRQGERDFDESTQETGAFCAGASYSNGPSSIGAVETST